jgi:hypothetical protein
MNKTLLTRAFAFSVFCIGASHAVGQVHKCVTPSGKIEFTNKPCASDSKAERVQAQPNTLDTSNERYQSLKAENQRLRQELGSQQRQQQPQRPISLGSSYACDIAKQNYATTVNSRYKGRRDSGGEAERITMYKECGLREPDRVIIEHRRR